MTFEVKSVYESELAKYLRYGDGILMRCRNNENCSELCYLGKIITTTITPMYFG